MLTLTWVDELISSPYIDWGVHSVSNVKTIYYQGIERKFKNARYLDSFISEYAYIPKQSNRDKQQLVVELIFNTSQGTKSVKPQMD